MWFWGPNLGNLFRLRMMAPGCLPRVLFSILIEPLLPIEGCKVGSSGVDVDVPSDESCPWCPQSTQGLFPLHPASGYCLWKISHHVLLSAGLCWSLLEQQLVQLQINWKEKFGSSFKTIPPPCLGFFFSRDKPFSWEILFVGFTVKLRALVEIKVICVWCGARKDTPLPGRPPF